MNNINLVPIQYKRSFRRKWYVLGGVVGSVLVIIMLSYLVYLPILEINRAEKEQIDLDAKLASNVFTDVRNMIEETDVIQKEKLDIETSLKQIDMHSHVSRKTMDIIVSNAPGGIRTNEIIMDGALKTTSISGNAENVTSVAQYIMGLYHTNQFEDIRYTTNKNSDLGIKWQVEYTIEIQHKDFEEEEIQEKVAESQDIEEDSVGEEDIL